MEALKAIYTRRAVRNYKDIMVTSDVLLPLLHAAVQAPSAYNQQPWEFAIFQGKHKLAEYSEEAKAVFLGQLVEEGVGGEMQSDMRATLSDPHLNIFYNANTLLVILAKTGGLNPNEDCFLAAQNLMLAAHAEGIATCPVGFARPWLNLPETKRRLTIPDRLQAVFPMIIGYPDEITEAPPRNDPFIVAWEVSHLDQVQVGAP